MPFEIVHFRESEKILKEKRLVKDVKVTLEYIDDVLCGTIHRRELLRQALDEMDWRDNGSLNIIDGRRYQYKGFKKGVALEGDSFASYEYLWTGLYLTNSSHPFYPLKLTMAFRSQLLSNKLLNQV